MQGVSPDSWPIKTVRQQLYGFWEYYRIYTHSAAHAAAVAALTIFGLLVFIDPLFAVIAIAAYVVPPVVLYVFGSQSTQAGANAVNGADAASRMQNGKAAVGDSESDTDSDTDSDDGDTDSDTDSDDGDTDGDRVDSDRDSTGSDTDSDN